MTTFPNIPACATWPVTRDFDPRHVRIWGLLCMWQDGRCAVCGLRGDLVTDHDHNTGLIRGHLCRGCNAKEGLRWWAMPAFAHWRAGLNPAHLLNHHEPYWAHIPNEPRSMEQLRAAAVGAWSDDPLPSPEVALAAGMRRAMLAAS